VSPAHLGSSGVAWPRRAPVPGVRIRRRRRRILSV